jgi:hypothetical protein
VSRSAFELAQATYRDFERLDGLSDKARLITIGKEDGFPLDDPRELGSGQRLELRKGLEHAPALSQSGLSVQQNRDISEPAWRFCAWFTAPGTWKRS